MEENSFNLPLMDKFSYPLTMLKYSSFKDFEVDQPKTNDYDDNLLSRLAGIGIQESTFNMDMFRVNLPSDNTPYQSFETPLGWEIAFESESSIYELDIVKKKLQYEWKKGNKIFPLEQDIFNAFKLCPPSKVKVLIIGQDPYPQMDSQLCVPIANGKAFSLRYGGDDTGSLTNIFTEIRRTFPGIPLEHGDLTSWAEQGVLLLNSQLTVTQNDPGSHSKLKIWDYWMEYIIKWVCDNCPGLICLLWGTKARSFTIGDHPPIGKKIFKLTCGHPSNKNTSAEPFAGNGHFSEVYYEIERQNRLTYEKNFKLNSEGKELLPYKDQINWALVHPVENKETKQIVEIAGVKSTQFNFGAVVTTNTKVENNIQSKSESVNNITNIVNIYNEKINNDELLNKYPHLRGNPSFSGGYL